MVVLKLASVINALTQVCNNGIIIMIALDNGAVNSLYPLWDVLGVGTVENTNLVGSIHDKGVIIDIVYQAESLYLEAVYYRFYRFVNGVATDVVLTYIIIRKARHTRFNEVCQGLGMVSMKMRTIRRYAIT